MAWPPDDAHGLLYRSAHSLKAFTDAIAVTELCILSTDRAQEHFV